MTSLDFGEVGVGTFAELKFTITNTGGSKLSGVVAEECDDFSVRGIAVYDLGANQSQEMTVRFTPTATGPANCTVTLGNDHCDGIPVTGTGGSVCCDVDPANLDFNGVEQGAHRDTTFTISNCGLAAISGNVSLNCTHYQILSGGGAWTLQPGQTRDVAVRFAPAADGVHQCTIDLGSASCGTVACTGETGEVECFISEDDSNIDFDTVTVGATKDTTIEILNDGQITLEGTVTILGICSDPGAFSIIQGQTFNLLPGERRQVVIRFQPQSAGLKKCSIKTNTITIPKEQPIDACGDILVSGVGASEP